MDGLGLSYRPFCRDVDRGSNNFFRKSPKHKSARKKQKADLAAQEKKHRKDLLVQIALEDYKQSWVMVMKHGGIMPPIEIFILHMNTLAEAILSETPLEENKYIELLKRSEALIDAHRKYKRPENSS